jgi:hypothetical protein
MAFIKHSTKIYMSRSLFRFCMIACKEWREQLVTIKKNRSLVDINRDESELLCCVCKIICNSKCNLMYMNMEILMTALMITIDYKT